MSFSIENNNNNEFQRAFSLTFCTHLYHHCWKANHQWIFLKAVKQVSIATQHSSSMQKIFAKEEKNFEGNAQQYEKGKRSFTWK